MHKTIVLSQCGSRQRSTTDSPVVSFDSVGRRSLPHAGRFRRRSPDAWFRRRTLVDLMRSAVNLLYSPHVVRAESIISQCHQIHFLQPGAPKLLFLLDTVVAPGSLLSESSSTWS